MDIYSLNTKELSKYVSKQAKLANQALTRLENSGKSKYSPAYHDVMRSGGRFYVKGKTHDEIYNELLRINEFNKQPSARSRNITTKQVLKDEIFQHNLLGDSAISDAQFDIFKQGIAQMSELQSTHRNYSNKEEFYKNLKEFFSHDTIKQHRFRDADEMVEKWNEFLKAQKKADFRPVSDADNVPFIILNP